MTPSHPSPSIRVVATLPRGIYQMLEEIASAEGRAVGNLAGYVLEEWVRAEHKSARQATAEPKTTVIRAVFNATPQTVAL